MLLVFKNKNSVNNNPVVCFLISWFDAGGLDFPQWYPHCYCSTLSGHVAKNSSARNTGLVSGKSYMRYRDKNCVKSFKFLFLNAKIAITCKTNSYKLKKRQKLEVRKNLLNYNITLNCRFVYKREGEILGQ